MGEPTNDEWWRHDEPAVNDRQARERRAAERRRPEEDPVLRRREPSPRAARRSRRASRDGPRRGRRAAPRAPPLQGPALGSSAVGHRGGPAQRYGYSAPERGGHGSTIPDDRLPRRRPRAAASARLVPAERAPAARDVGKQRRLEVPASLAHAWARHPSRGVPCGGGRARGRAACHRGSRRVRMRCLPRGPRCRGTRDERGGGYDRGRGDNPGRRNR